MLPHPHPPNTASFLLCHHSCAFFIVLEFCSLSESAAACLLPSPLSMLHILTVQSCGQNASHFFMVACHWGHGLCNAIFWFVLSNNSKCKCKIKKSKKWRATSALDYLLLWLKESLALKSPENSREISLFKNTLQISVVNLHALSPQFPFTSPESSPSTLLHYICQLWQKLQWDYTSFFQCFYYYYFLSYFISSTGKVLS